jgi:low temperature requirement protein LtrA
MQGRTIDRFRDWFWHPPRAHGETIQNRTVSNLELLYDLVYVAIIGQAAHTLAGDVTARGVLEFAAIFGTIWLAWINGSLYVELHGRQDGRTRALVFVQIGILALLAVFTGSAAGETGRQFAIVYGLYLAFQMWLWYSVRRRDEPEYMTVTGLWLAGMLVSLVTVLISAVLPPDLRLLVWIANGVGWVAGIKLLGYRSVMFQRGVAPTESMVERFGLFTIIVLGEVVIGVVDGLSHAEQDAITIATGALGLIVGFGFWWMYFDVVGRRLPRPNGPAVADWIIGHLPITLAIAAAGAGMVSLLEHAHEPVAPATTSWLLAGSVALGLIGIVVAALALDDARRLPAVYRPLSVAMALGAAAALVVGALSPAPLLLAALLVAILSVLWGVVVALFLRVGAWGEDEAPAAEGSRVASPE